MVGIPSLQSLVGVHAGTSTFGSTGAAECGIDWSLNQVWQLNATYLSSYNPLTGLETDYNDLTSLQGVNDSIGVTLEGLVTLTGGGSLYNGGLVVENLGPSVNFANGLNYPPPNFGTAQMCCTQVTGLPFVADRGAGNSVIGVLNRTQISLVGPFVSSYLATVNWPAGYFHCQMCAGPHNAGKIWSAYSNTTAGIQLDQFTFNTIVFSGVTTLGNWVATDFDATWTTVAISGICYDQTDNTLIMVVFGGASNSNKLVKVSISLTSTILWTADVPDNFSDELVVGNCFQFSTIKYGKIGLFTNSPAKVTLYDTSDGSVTSTYTAGLAGISQIGAVGGQCYNDTLGAIVLPMTFNQTVGSPDLRNSTPTSFTGWSLLYVDAPAPPPAPSSTRRFLAEMGPVRDIQIGPPVPPPLPSNSVGTIGLDVDVAGVGAGGSYGTIALDVAVAGVGHGGTTSTGTIDLDVAVAGVGAGGIAVGLTSMTLRNTSGVTQPIGSCTQIFGHPFKKGDIPAGQAPIFKTSGGTIIPFSMSKNLATWSDGSLKHAAFMLRLPVSIGGGSFLPINIFSGGSVPSASSRALSDFAAGGLDLNVFVTGQDQLVGDWTSNLNQGISAANSDNYVYMDGDAGKVWRIRASFRQSGSNHGQLEGYWFVQALNDASGALGGVRYLCRVTQPWYDVLVPAPQYRSFSAFKTRNGTTDIRDLVATLPAPFNFAWSGSSVQFNTPNTGLFQTGLALKMSSTGTLPTGLDSTTLYCPFVASPTQVYFGANFPAVVSQGGAFCVTPTNAGTGTHTATFYPMVSQWGSLWTAEANGRYSYIQGGGSASSDSTILCQMNSAYWCSTKVLPPYAVSSYSPTSTTPYNYYIGTAGPVTRNIGTTGEREDIGLLNDWQARHIFTQAAADEQVVRVVSLVGGHLPVCFRQSATKSIPVANNTTYAGMPAANLNFRYNNDHPSGYFPPSIANVWTQGWSGIDLSHITPFNYYAYLLNAEPQSMDMLVEYGAVGQVGGYPGTDTAVVSGAKNFIGGVRNSVINGTTRYGVFLGENLLRTPAWIIRGMVSTQILPDTLPENAQYQNYFNALISDTLAGIAGYITMLTSSANSYVTTNGMWSEQQNGGGGVGAMWARSYYAGVVAFTYALTERSNALSFMNYLAKWPAHLRSSFGAWGLGYYNAIERSGGSNESLYVTSDTKFAFNGGSNSGFSASWNSGVSTTLFNMSPPNATNGYVLANGDKFIFNGDIDGVKPAGFTGWTEYYAVLVTGNKCGLSATVGGSPIAISDTGSVGTIYCVPVVEPASGFLGYVAATGYIPNLYFSNSYASAIGGTVDPALLSALLNGILAIPGSGGAYNANPKYAVRSTYV